MSDISKARFFLKAHGSKLATLDSFQLMLSTAEQKYKEVRLQNKRDHTRDYSQQELETAVDLGVLRYLKNHGQLPNGVAEIVHPETSRARKFELAKEWFTA